MALVGQLGLLATAAEADRDEDQQAFHDEEDDDRDRERERVELVCRLAGDRDRSGREEARWLLVARLRRQWRYVGSARTGSNNRANDEQESYGRRGGQFRPFSEADQRHANSWVLGAQVGLNASLSRALT